MPKLPSVMPLLSYRSGERVERGMAAVLTKEPASRLSGQRVPQEGQRRNSVSSLSLRITMEEKTGLAFSCLFLHVYSAFSGFRKGLMEALWQVEFL